MPISIFSNFDGDVLSVDKTNSVAWLCETSWDLPAQIYELERWLDKHGNDLPAGNYVADIGFTQRPSASGGGGCLSVSMMQTLVKLGIEVWFSEHPS